MRKLFINSTLIVGSFVVALAIIEVFLRLLGWGQLVEYSPNDQWGYLMKPSQTVYSYGHPVQINKYGLRGPEIEQNKKEGVVRIVFLGDSITYGGNMIKEKELFCRIVESLLNNNKVAAEIINLSASGWSPRNWMEYIKANGYFEADIIMPILTENDLVQAFSPKDRWHEYQENQPFFRVHTVLWKMSVILEDFIKSKDHWVAHTYKSWFANEKIPDQVDLQKQVELPSDDNTSSSSTMTLNTDILVQLSDLTKINNIDLLPVFIPAKQPPKNVKMIWAPFEKLLPDALDLRDMLNDDSFFMDNVHMTVKGHKLVGEKIYDRVNKHIGQTMIMDKTS